MCYHTEITSNIALLEAKFKAKALIPDALPKGRLVAHAHPGMPVLTNEFPDIIQFYRWGLIPAWTKDIPSAEKIQKMTLNAAGETLFEKPSFKASIQYRRCIILIDGFFEWRTENHQKIPYKIQYPDPLDGSTAFAVGGLWSVWNDPFTGLQFHTCSVVTTEANELMSYVHNTKKRMPLIFKRGEERKWLNPNLEKNEIVRLIKPLEDGYLKAVEL